MPDDALHRTQAWLQSAILDPVSADAAPEFVTASTTLTARDRLAIYQQGYRARLVECMRAHFPVLHRLLDDEVFDAFALEYLRRRPSRSHTLHVLGDGFSDFLRETRPEEDPAADDGWIATLIDLTHFERAFAGAYAASGPEGRVYPTPEDLPEAGSQAWAATVLVLAPCARLMRAGAPVHTFAAAVRRGEEPPIPPRSPVYLCLSRLDFTVTVTELEAREFDLLSRLAAGAALGRAATGARASVARSDAAVRRWLDRCLFSTCTTAQPMTAG
ncbi:DUF2063 domain-containing protein [Nocardiopsis gilva YIM 90087]|uniref:DUF2063 domain-containing protein n=1 Tax=Nocardiopsis gilva YIM 90087 TaxID=1235441 RepID=A0A223S9G7_9ACTN|nr:DNA-binding domain-containing protein [Nocardiopsis gilva]ASU84729.1 DUF2063 domain-containing protein [Nocardiopsis gilva YIM 90087]